MPGSLGRLPFASSRHDPHRGGGALSLRPRPVMQRAGGLVGAGSRRWLIERYRIGPVLRALRRVTDPLFRQAGIDLDEP